MSLTPSLPPEIDLDYKPEPPPFPLYRASPLLIEEMSFEFGSPVPQKFADALTAHLVEFQLSNVSVKIEPPKDPAPLSDQYLHYLGGILFLEHPRTANAARFSNPCWCRGVCHQAWSFPFCRHADYMKYSCNQSGKFPLDTSGKHYPFE